MIQAGMSSNGVPVGTVKYRRRRVSASGSAGRLVASDPSDVAMSSIAAPAATRRSIASRSAREAGFDVRERFLGRGAVAEAGQPKVDFAAVPEAGAGRAQHVRLARQA